MFFQYVKAARRPFNPCLTGLSRKQLPTVPTKRVILKCSGRSLRRNRTKRFTLTQWMSTVHNLQTPGVSESLTQELKLLIKTRVSEKHSRTTRAFVLNCKIKPLPGLLPSRFLRSCLALRKLLASSVHSCFFCFSA